MSKLVENNTLLAFIEERFGVKTTDRHTDRVKWAGVSAACRGGEAASF